MKDIKAYLDEKVAQYNRPNFIKDDPISLPHSLSKAADREIIGFWVAVLAWGRRASIIKSGKRLLELMDYAPHDFIVNHEEADRKAFLDFKHRTFQPTDALYFLHWLQQYYQKEDSLEQAFARHLGPEDEHVGPALLGFERDFFALEEAPQRTRKHIATPARKSACKRLNMFLRWMVRRDEAGVDFGLWRQISPAQLLLPLDVHVGRQARALGLLQREKDDWAACLELGQAARALCAEDPAKYDFALFGMGVEGELL